MTLCASPNALPFASKAGPVPGFQIELGEKIAEQLGVKLTREWVVSAIQYRRADCDLVLDVIARKDTPPGGGVRISRPYHRSGVVLTVRGDSPASSLASLGSNQRVGVPVGSLVSMTLAMGRRRHVSVRVRGRDRCSVGQSRDRGGRRHPDDGRLVQPAACRQAVAPDSGVRQRPRFELEYYGRAASPRRQAASACRCGDRGPARRWHHRAASSVRTVDRRYEVKGSLPRS
ncbi:transporter substrate-binding domain-containing protein [Bradyrhizobium sp. AUGA SZCCT0283]|nr:transporter substrate-binding domain-containing protein [Bradyrhizobium sp. AUGA SZCCT0283]